MSNYTKTTNFAAKDSLPSGNAAKIVKGAEIDTEFNNIATASATKANANNAALTGTTVFETLSDGTIGVTGWVDEDNMSSNSAVLIPTQQSVKAYVDSQVTAQDLDVTDGSASIDIDLDSESLGILGGTGITSSASGTGVTLAIDSTVTTLTGTQTLTNKTLTSPTLTTPTITTSFTIGSATITEAELEILDGATVTTAELNVLDGITSTTAELNILDGVTSTAAELNILDGVTSTAAEINILDGVTSTTAELNILDGVTSTAAELNILDGVTSTATELNILDGVTATTAEINYVDGVTSNVQTQLNTKAPIAGATFTGTTTIPTADINGGAIDGTVIGGSTAAAGSFTTLGASGAITGTLGTAAQTNITSVGTLSALTVSGDLTVDTNSLKVDSSNNRVGILNASPDVTLDIGTATDAVHMPTGTTAQRPTGAAGYFRYNSTLEQFEGYTDAWGAIGGGGGSNLVSDTMTGDGSDTTLTLSNDPLNENNTQVYIDGVYQNKDTYSVSGTTLTFSAAPPNGSAVEAMTIQPTAVNVPADASVTSAKLSGALTTPGALTVTGNVDINGGYLDVGPSSGNIGKVGFDSNNVYIGSTSGTGQIIFKNNISSTDAPHSSGDTKMVITDSGVGVGTSSPRTLVNASSATGAILTLESADTSLTTNGVIGGIDFYSNDSSTNGTGAKVNIRAIGQNSSGTATALTFGTSSSGSATAVEAMRIDASGNLLVGKTDTSIGVAGSRFISNGQVQATASGQEVLLLNRLSSDGELLNFRKDGTTVGSISTNANSLPSDRNFKKNIENLSLGLNFISSLEPVTYNYKIDDDGAPVMAGLIAQDVETALTAEGVEANSMTLLQHKPTEDVKESNYQMDYLKLVPVLINAVKELTERLEQLESN